MILDIYITVLRMENIKDLQKTQTAEGNENMKTVKGLILLLSLLLSSVFVNNLYAEVTKTTGSASVGIFNRYIFRGYELSTDSFVVQPALSVSFKGFSAAYRPILVSAFKQGKKSYR